MSLVVKYRLPPTHKQGLVIASQSIAGNPYDETVANQLFRRIFRNSDFFQTHVHLGTLTFEKNQNHKNFLEKLDLRQSHDGHTLKSALTKSEELTNIKIKSASVDKGYKGHGIDPKEVTILISGQKRYNGKSLTRSIKKQLKRRSAIEPMIGHMKNDGRLGLSRLKGVVGDKINAILVGAGHNLRLILNHIRKMMKKNPLWAMQLIQNFLSKILSGIFGRFSRIFCVPENILMERLVIRV